MTKENDGVLLPVAHATQLSAKQQALLSEIGALMREERMEEGDLWFLVAAQWWQQHLALDGADEQHADDEDEDMEQESARKDASANEVANEPLVDLEFSSKKRKTVVLKPMLAEGRDYRLVSESIWNRLSHEFGYDWEIPREVIARGPARKLIVEVYPVMFQVFLWRSGMEAPEEVLDEREKPLVIVSSESSRIEEVQDQIWKAMKHKVRQFHPTANAKDLESVVQVSYRLSETSAWVPLKDAAAPTEPKQVSFQTAANHVRTQDPAKGTCIGELQLEQRDYRSGKERFHHLLVETRYADTANPMDWRNGKFLSEIQAREWRYQLKIGQLIDALDSDKKWYESRVIGLDEKRVKVHYRGWTAKWDEWLNRASDRIAPLHTMVRNWRAFEVNDEVQAGFSIPAKNFPEWKNGVVSEVERDEETGSLKIKISYDGEDEWRDAQDELLCAPGTHKAVNASTSTVSTISRLVPATSSSYTSYGRYGDRGRDHSYEYGRGKPDFVGVVGLQNLGNTCFMNSMLQCLINTPPLKDYFLKMDEETKKKAFHKDINVDNPLGMKGRIAIEFANLVWKMWGGEHSVVSPTSLKSVIGQYAPQFAGYQQQDSQEVMNFLLDGLHEDLNRVRSKPYTPAVERNGRDDPEVAREEWEMYLRRNDSVIVENFMGQLRSHLTCSNPDCGNESVTFDPFMSLSVPIPNEEIVVVQVQLFWANGSIPMKYAIRLAKDTSTLRDVKDKLSELSGIPFARLFFVEVWKHRILKALNDALPLEDLREDTLHAYELELPVTEYDFSSKSIHPPAAAKMTLKVNSNPSEKPMRLVALLHQAPCASPIDGRYSNGDSLTGDGYGAKQRRVEVELFNTPLLVSIEQHCTKADVHKKVWQIVKRLVSPKDTPTSFGCGDDQTLPYRLHVSQPNGTTSIISDFACSDEPADLPDATERTHCFTVEWSRQGYHQGYDESSAKRIELHESMKNLRISGGDSKDISLLNCLSKFTEREQLGETDTWYCPKCKDHVRAIKKFDLFSLPKILIFQLKRFRYAQSSFYMHRDKISTLVTFPISSLDLSEYVIGPQRGSPLLYDLFAVSEHSGGLGGGHYTAVAKNPDNQRWFSFNDSFTNETSAERAVTPRAYVLFYWKLVRILCEGAPGPVATITAGSSFMSTFGNSIRDARCFGPISFNDPLSPTLLPLSPSNFLVEDMSLRYDACLCIITNEELRLGSCRSAYCSKRRRKSSTRPWCSATSARMISWCGAREIEIVSMRRQANVHVSSASMSHGAAFGVVVRHPSCPNTAATFDEEQGGKCAKYPDSAYIVFLDTVGAAALAAPMANTSAPVITGISRPKQSASAQAPEQDTADRRDQEHEVVPVHERQRVVFEFKGVFAVAVAVIQTEPSTAVLIRDVAQRNPHAIAAGYPHEMTESDADSTRLTFWIPLKVDSVSLKADTILGQTLMFWNRERSEK